jgi:hypothetical protein
VDSCAGDELMPPHCRVREVDEANNWSPRTSIYLAFPIGTGSR